jgi:hypothetical protein
MSTGLYLIVDAVNAIGAAALSTAADIGVAVSAAASAGGLSGGAGAGTGMGGSSATGPGSSTTAGGLDSALAWGKTTVLTPEQAVAALRSLQNRINPLSGQMGSR